MGLDKKEQDQIWASMMAHRRRLGQDPDDHLSIRRRMELEFVNILLIINTILNKLSVRADGTYQVATTGRRLNATHILLVLLIGIGITATTLVWMTYQETLFTNDRRKISRSRVEYLGRALLTNPHINIKTEGSDFVIIPIDDIMSAPIRVPHNIPPEELKRLEPK